MGTGNRQSLDFPIYRGSRQTHYRKTSTEINMLGKLTDKQIEHVLHRQSIGRIGCYAEDRIYIVPVTYVFHKGYIYAHSKEGLKVQMMRKNPHVCFQVDALENMANWQSVIIWGEYEELRGENEQNI